MRPRERIGDAHFERFKAMCKDCELHPLSPPWEMGIMMYTGYECSYSGDQVSDVLFAAQKYFRYVEPEQPAIQCPKFDKQKQIFDGELRQVLKKMAQEKARHELGPKTLTGIKEGGG